MSAWDRGDVDVLAVLPDVTPGFPSSVEGLTVGPDGNIYVTSFGFNATGATQRQSVLYVIKPNGNLVRKVPSPIPALTRLGWPSIRSMDFFWFSTLGQAKFCMWIRRRATSSVFSTPTLAGSGLNALTFDKQGNVYISDSFNGVIWKTGPSGGTPTAWSSDPLLATWHEASRRPSGQMALSSTMPARFCLSQTPQPIRSSKFR